MFILNATARKHSPDQLDQRVFEATLHIKQRLGQIAVPLRPFRGTELQEVGEPGATLLASEGPNAVDRPFRQQRANVFEFEQIRLGDADRLISGKENVAVRQAVRGVCRQYCFIFGVLADDFRQGLGTDRKSLAGDNLFEGRGHAVEGIGCFAPEGDGTVHHFLKQYSAALPAGQ